MNLLSIRNSEIGIENGQNYFVCCRNLAEHERIVGKLAVPLLPEFCPARFNGRSCVSPADSVEISGKGCPGKRKAVSVPPIVLRIVLPGHHLSQPLAVNLRG